MIPYAQTYRTIHAEAASLEELRQKVADHTLAPGSTGTLELYAVRQSVLGVTTCLFPLGPGYGVDIQVQNALEGAGLIVTKIEGFNGIPGHRCDMRVTFRVPDAAPSDYATPSAFVIPLLVVIGALILLSLAISLVNITFTGVVKAVDEAAGPFGWLLWVGLGLGVGALALKSLSKGGRRLQLRGAQ